MADTARDGRAYPLLAGEPSGVDPEPSESLQEGAAGTAASSAARLAGGTHNARGVYDCEHGFRHGACPIASCNHQAAPDIVDGRNARDLAELVIAWSSRVTCPQCGEGYPLGSACGPTHAVIKARVGYADDLLRKADA